MNVDRVVVYTWLVAGALAGLAGVLQGLVLAFAQHRLPAPAADLRSGRARRDRQRVRGALGGLLLGVAMELSTWEELAGGVDPVYKPVVAFVVLIGVLLVRPQGLLGRARLL